LQQLLPLMTPWRLIMQAIFCCQPSLVCLPLSAVTKSERRGSLRVSGPALGGAYTFGPLGRQIQLDVLAVYPYGPAWQADADKTQIFIESPGVGAVQIGWGGPFLEESTISGEDADFLCCEFFD
jgi:hypothetical protein